MIDLKCILSNYDELIVFFEQMSDSESGTIGAKSSEFLNKLHLFKTFFLM